MGLQTLRSIYKDKGQEFINGLFNSYVIVCEQIDGSRFLFQKQVDDTIVYYKGAGKEISNIERTMMRFYEKAISYIDNLNIDTIEKIPDNWTFGFQYFPSLNPINIAYDRLPKNNLILTDISIRNESGKIIKIINDPKVLNNWADILEVERPPFIFTGKLSDEQKNKIKNFLETNEQDLKELFKSNSFTRYIISILNPELKTSALSNSLDKSIEGIIFKFIKPGEKEYYSAKLIDPILHELRRNKKPRRKPNHMYQIAMLDIVEFIEQVDMSRYMLTSDSQEDRYIELISLIFNDYVSTNGHKYVGVDFEVPDFAKNPEFDVNIDFVKNARTKDILSNDHMKNLFKIFLSSFRKYRKNATDILTDTVISSINNIVDSIESKVREKSQKTGAMDFSSFIKTQRYQNERSIFECEIFEGLTLDTTEHGNKKVNIIVGRFQPFTLGHAKVFEQIHRQNGYPVIVFLVRGKKPNPEKNPINVDLQMRMFAAMQRQYRFLESIQVINMAAIDKIFNSLRPAYEPVLWGAGTDRLKAYGYQIDRYRDELNALPEFKMYEIKRGDEDISATKVRNAIKIDDFKTFSRMTPRSIHKFYEELKLELGVAEVANESINESHTKHTRKWEAEYNKWKRNGDTTAPSRRLEVLRADFGYNNGTAESNVKSFLLNNVHLDESDFSLGEIFPGNYVPEIRRDLSGKYHGFEIKFNNNVTIFGKNYRKNDIIYITNKFIQTKSGAKAIFLKKTLTPEAVGITGKNYHTAPEFLSDIRKFVNRSNFPDKYKNFLINSCEIIYKNNRTNNIYEDFDEYSKSRRAIIYNTGDSHFEGIDSISINNFQNDFGELLGSFMLFNILRKTGSGAIYPSASNEPLIDFYFDGYKISSKAGKGASPSAGTAMRLIDNAYKKEEIIFDNEETEFYESVVKHWLNPPKLARSTIYSTIMKLAYLHNGPKSAFNYMIDKFNLTIDTITQENLLTQLDNLVQNKDSFMSFLSEFISLSGASSKIASDQYYDQYIKKMESRDANRIGLVFYPIMVETEISLNEKFSNVLTKLVQKVTNIKQVYLDVKVKDNSFIFKTLEFKSSDFVFNRAGSINNPFLKTMAIRMIK